jgi:hypothetical protein
MLSILCQFSSFQMTGVRRREVIRNRLSQTPAGRESDMRVRSASVATDQRVRRSAVTRHARMDTGAGTFFYPTGVSRQFFFPMSSSTIRRSGAYDTFEHSKESRYKRSVGAFCIRVSAYDGQRAGTRDLTVGVKSYNAMFFQGQGNDMKADPSGNGVTDSE